MKPASNFSRTEVLTDRQNLATDNRARVLVLTSTFPRWSSDTEPAFVYSLCKHLSNNYDIWVLAPHAPGAKTHERFDRNIQVVRFRYFLEWGENLAYQGGILAKLRSKRLRYLLVVPFLIAQWVAILRLLAQQRFDVVHAHWLIPQGFLAAIAKVLLPHFPALVCTSHGTDLNGLQSGMFARIKRFSILQSDAYTVVSVDMKRNAQSLGVDMNRTSVIPMGVDARILFTPNAEVIRAHRQLLFVGRLDVQKGIELLIHVMPAILAEYSDCTLKIIGNGPQQRQLQEQIDRMGLNAHIELVGAVPNVDLPLHFRNSTLLVFPSLGSEGLGLVCAEALACECPVVASNLPAVLEVVQHEISGLIFQQGDCKDLTSKILVMLADPARRRAMGAAGREHVLAHFDWVRIETEFTRVFERVRKHE